MKGSVEGADQGRRVAGWGPPAVAIALLGLGLAAAWRSDSGAPSTSRLQTDTPDSRELSSGWGVDAIVSGHLQAEQRPMFVDRLRATGIHYLRERNHGDSRDPAIWRTGEFATYRDLRDEGFGVVAFATLPGRPVGVSPPNRLHEDLLEVYRTSRELGRRTRGLVAAWELPNEPDVFFIPDLPDRFAAYSKALYLGLRDGAAHAGGEHEPAVLMGALGLFPGPWLERAAANGLYDYTDALNVHFYGHARDFGDSLRAHQAFARKHVVDRELPLWVTECGIHSVPNDDVEEARGREIQREFTVETAAAALEAGVAVFMPFVMIWERQPFWSLIRGNGDPYPAWDAYRRFTLDHPLPTAPAVARPVAPNRIVVQWLPNNATTIPDKVSGTYWFRGNGRDVEPILGRWLVYNLSASAVAGGLRLEADPGLEVARTGVDEDRTSGGGIPLRIPAFGVAEVRVAVMAAEALTMRGKLGAAFEPAFVRAGLARSTAEIWAGIRPARKVLPIGHEIAATLPRAEPVDWIWAPEAVADQTSGGVWLGFNGVAPGSARESGGLSEQWDRFVVLNDGQDPRLPPMAVTRVEGLPGGVDAFLRIRFPARRGAAPQVRVDLVDDRGQRFAVGENLGRNPTRSPRNELYLAFRDFHPYAFGRLTEEPVFRPEAVREIQLRFYPPDGEASVALRLDVVEPEE